MNARKLTKGQREILVSAIASELEHGIRKPITVALKKWREGIEAGEFGKSYSTYAKQMFALEDEGLIARDYGDDPSRDTSIAYVVCLKAADARVSA